MSICHWARPNVLIPAEIPSLAADSNDNLNLWWCLAISEDIFEQFLNSLRAIADFMVNGTGLAGFSVNWSDNKS